MNTVILGFPDSRAASDRLAAELGLPGDEVQVRRFPDGEALVRIPMAAQTVILYRSLDDPDSKLIELILAAAAARDAGATRVILIAPYLAYMRQDAAFHAGEAVSQRVIGALISDHFDGLLTVDPHLHRISRLSEAVPRIPAIALSAAPVLRRCIEVGARPVIVGPDSEARAWTECIAAPLGLDMLIGGKERRSDTEVSVWIDDIDLVAGRPAILVDDVVSTGRTLQSSAGLLRRAGATDVQALVTHCLADGDVLKALTASGIRRLASCDSVAGSTATLSLAPILAIAVREAGFAGVSANR